MSRIYRLCRSILALSFAAAVSAALVQAKSGVIWELELDQPVRWFKTSPSGVFLVGTNREILGVGPDSGNVLWRIGPIKDSHSNYVELLADSAAALLSVGIQDSSGVPPVSLIDLRDGHTLWTCQQAGVLSSTGSFLVPGTDKLLVRATTSPDGFNKTAVLVDFASGVPIWTSESIGEFKPVLSFWYGWRQIRAHQIPFRDTDSSMVFHMRDREFQRFDLNTGALLWTAQAPEVRRVEHHPDEGSEIEEEADIEFNLAPMLASSTGDRFYAPYRNSVAAFSLATGGCLWPVPPELNGAVAQMEEVPTGLLVRTIEWTLKEPHNAVLLLDANTGAVRWRWPSKNLIRNPGYWEDASNFLLEEGRVVIAAEGKIRTADLAQGRDQTFAKLKFGGDARTLLHMPDSYVVIGRSDLGIYAKADGRCTKKYYSNPPDEVGWGLALLALSAVMNDWVKPSLGLEVLDIDYSLSEERESYVYFLASVKAGELKGPGIVRVRRETGERAGGIYVGTRRPYFSLDSEGRIYLRSGPNSILCSRF